MDQLQIEKNVPLKNFCTFAIGGEAKFFVNWKNHDEIKEILSFAKKENLKTFVFGGGSNLLFADEGFDGLVIRNMTKEVQEENGLLKADSGLSWVRLHAFMNKSNLYGLEAFSGLPGTLGGAIYGNAGCHGVEMKDVIRKIEVISKSTGEFVQIPANKIEFAYRWSSLKENTDLIVTAVWLQVSKDPENNTGDPLHFAEFRKQNQPQGLTTGSFFQNPPNDYAGRLIEASGLKGKKVGGICTSDKHANFFINDGKGTAADVIALKDLIIEEVKKQQGITLKPEVQIVAKV